MFIAMNRFKVKKGLEDEFEGVWKGRETRLADVPGVVAFHLLRGPECDDHRLFASHTVWETRQAFVDWTRSEAFRAAHRDAGGRRNMYLDGPHFEGFDVVQHLEFG